MRVSGRECQDVATYKEGAMIDWARIKDLRSEIGSIDFLEVVEMFLDEADEVVSRLGGLPALDQVEGQLHFLKGAALNLGLTDLAARCQDGERRAANGDARSVDLAEVVLIYNASRQLLSDSLDRISVA